MGIQQNLFTWIVLCKRNSLKPNVMFLQNIKKQESVENKKEGGGTVCWKLNRFPTVLLSSPLW